MRFIDESLARMAKYKYKRNMSLGFVLSFAWLVGGTHAIYNVEWLGWDRVEPITYTVGQGCFVLGLFYILRMKNKEEIKRGLAHTQADSAEDCIWIPEYGLYDPMRKTNLIDELEKVAAEIEMLEAERLM